MQQFLEEKGITINNMEPQFIPNAHTEGLSEEQVDEVLELINKLEDDDDVQKVFHTLP
jgi:transcriptional/translational regulatory protein YebC/TACO1